MNYLVLFILFIPVVFCENEENTPPFPDDFKCSLPDVKSVDDNLDLTRFRSDFSKISEVKFPGLIGPLNERLICKIKCIDGNWVGPLCSNTPDGRFQPILRECVYRNDHPLLAISFKNSSIDKHTSFPHGSLITARCKHFGHYKMKGDGLLHCENGEWKPKLPECVPTTVITNFTGDAPPTIQYTVVSGSAVVDPSGELLVFPDSTLRLDCISPRALGDPEWSWTQALGHHSAAWSLDEGETAETETHYRVTLNKMSARHSDQYTCTSPGGHTNTITIKVVSVTCPPLNASTQHLRQFAQGSRLGHAAHFSCQPGYHLNGSALLTCMGDAIYCPDPIVPEDGRLVSGMTTKDKHPVGDLIIYACDEGYEIVGESSIVCTETGFWSHPPPFCFLPSEIRKTDTIYVENTTLVYFEE
ncbi:locomotion-related protein Hikaru genki isoform X2 [Pectinophora gossypiella]|uniref:locomotion-related protein Hikaru genki isoform X2 n=1 Tax=Pectinophora gossypiella TaxID=13191 RepID=UPI00214EB8C2|nr:locomotion-related protein Hikaru genki isoform X2 [Pectinophora gossypiella]